MKRALAIIVGVALVCVVAYLSWLNPAAVEFRFTPTRGVQAPLAALMVFAFIVGVVLVLTVMMIQAGHRAIVTWREDRRQRRIERIDEWEERGKQLVWSGHTQEGRALLQKAWKRGPASAHAVLALAASYRDTGELQRVREVLAEAATEYHTNPDVLLALAEAHRAVGDEAACIAILERLRALQPCAPRAVRALCDRYVEANRWLDAATLQEALLSMLRDSGQAVREREYLAVLRYQAAINEADAVTRLRALEALADSRAASVPVWVSLGDALQAVGRTDETSVVWERALRSHPRTVFVERLAAIATEPGHRHRLRTVLRKLGSDQVRPDTVRLFRAQLHLADGGVDEAARELDAIQEPANAPALLHDLWGEVHHHRGHWEQAVAAYAKAGGKLRGYRCRACERAATQWVGYCPQCGRWDSYRSNVEIAMA